MNATIVSFAGLVVLLTASVAVVIGTLVLAGLAATKRLTPPHTRALVLSLGALLAQGVLGFLGLFHGDVFERFTRSRDLAMVDEHAKELVAAIQLFEREHARAPKRLKELVPEFLSTIPTTGLWSWPDYEYFAGARASNGDWGLVVWIPKFFVDFDGNRRFEYRPLAAADAKPGTALRHGDWVYVPDSD